MGNNLAPDLTAFVVVFAVLDLIALLALVATAAVGATTFFRRHRGVRVARHERFATYYGHLATGH